MLLSELNLHTNYSCPLACRYCVQRNDEKLINQYLTADEMIERVQKFLDYIKQPKCKINISGGEPLLKYKDIQKLMEHFPNNSYEISTSGYLLTEEKAKYFSQFGVSYILSVDGGEKVTNYLRPLANGNKGYFEQFKKNIPHILYYAPKTRAKLIVSKNLISEVYSTYLELERLGFNSIFITPNVYENEVDNNHPELQTGVWLDEDWKNFENQINQIYNEIELGLKINKKRCLISNIIAPATKMMVTDEDKIFNPYKMICSVLDFKVGTGPAQGQYTENFGEISACMGKNNFPQLGTQYNLLEKVKNDFEALTGVCPRDEKCPYQKTCIYSVCISENLKYDFSNAWVASNFQCLTQKIYQKYARNFLELLHNNMELPVTKYYLDIIDEGRRYYGSISSE